MVSVTATRSRVRGEFVHLAHRGLGLSDFALAVAKLVTRAVPGDGFCMVTLDPATLLPTSEIVVNGLPPAFIPRLTEIEFGEADYNKLTDLARFGRPTASLNQATRGNLELSVRQRELRRPSGFGDELRSVLADSGGGTWGAMTLLREAGRPVYTNAEVDFVESLSTTLAEGVRRATLLDESIRGADDPAVGVLVLSDDDSVELADAAADRWLDDLGVVDAPGAPLPLVIRSVAARARRITSSAANDAHDLGDASARVRTQSGKLLIVRGSVLGGGDSARVAVLLEVVRPIEMAPLIADSYGLTSRERTITELVAQGLATKEISQRLHLAVYTVQDHLKSIFDKTDTASRGELVARLFFDHYAPRLSNRHRPLADANPPTASTASAASTD
jgi:DNA-binding NarL/FixJ family response regulator